MIYNMYSHFSGVDIYIMQSDAAVQETSTRVIIFFSFLDLLTRRTDTRTSPWTWIVRIILPEEERIRLIG